MTDWPVKTLGDVCEIYQPQTIGLKDMMSDGPYVVYGANGPIGRYDRFNHENSEVTVTCRGATCGTVNVTPPQVWITGNAMVVRPNEAEMSKLLLKYWLEGLDYSSVITGAAQPQITRTTLSPMKIPVPPLEEQKRIVELLDAATAHVTELTSCYEQARTHANDLLESSFLELFADAFESHPKRKMGEVLQIARGGSPRPISEYITKSPKGVNWIKIGDASSSTKYIYETAQKIKPEGVSRSRMVYPGDFLLSNSMSFGRPYIMKTEGCIHDGWLVLRDSKGELDQDFLFYLLGSRFMYEKFSQLAAGSTVQNLNSALVSSVEIPVPPIDFQKRIAEKARMLEENVARLNEVNQLRLQAAKDLRQSILEAAFAGDL